MAAIVREAVTAKENVGLLVGRAMGNSVIRNCVTGRLADNELKSRVVGGKNVGGLAGYADSGVSIEKCVSNCNVAGTSEHDSSYAGGMAGVLKGKASESISRGNVFLMSGMAGGFAGASEGDISDCASFGSCETCVSASFNSPSGGFVGLQRGGSIARCYSTGSVKNGEAWGGFAGNQLFGTDGHCYYDDKSKAVDSAFGTLKTHEQMGFKETYEGFDFEEVWEQIEEETYPTPKALSESQPLSGNRRQFLVQFKIHGPTFRNPVHWGSEWDGELVSSQQVSINGRPKQEPLFISEGRVDWLVESEFGKDAVGVSGSSSIRKDEVIEANAVWTESLREASLKAGDVFMDEKSLAFGFVAGNSFAIDSSSRFYINGTPTALHLDPKVFAEPNAWIHYAEPGKGFDWVVFCGERRGRGSVLEGVSADALIQVALSYFAYLHGEALSWPDEGFPAPMLDKGDSIAGAELSVPCEMAESESGEFAMHWHPRKDWKDGLAELELEYKANIKAEAYDVFGRPVALDIDHIEAAEDEETVALRDCLEN
jgi:hypothetical protein